MGTLAYVTSSDVKRINRLPDTLGMRHEISKQISHRSGCESQMLLVDIKISEIGTPEQLKAVICPRTAILFVLNISEPDWQIKRKERLAIGKKDGVPSFNDAAADFPPKSRWIEYVKMGFDLVNFGGGKGLHGPKCSGPLLGRKDLVDAAGINASPRGGTIGRGIVRHEVGVKRNHGARCASQWRLELPKERSEI